MNAYPMHTPPGGFVKPNASLGDEEVVNDALGIVSEADSTGLDEDKETGDAKAQNFDTHED